MEASQFTARRSGSLVSIPEGGIAFVPEPLPSAGATLDRSVAIHLAQAEQELGRLDGIAAILPEPELLIAPFLRKEAELSSRIEGTQTTYEDLLLFEIDRDSRSSSDTREVWNYVTALKYALKRAGDIPFGKRLLCETHSLLLEGTDQEARSGHFRTQQVYIGPKGQPIEYARFVPPPVHSLDTAFANLEKYLVEPDDTPLLVRLAIAHYQFEAIHPFFDGNGRIGRLMIPLLLCREGAIVAPMLYISAYFERRRSLYTDLLFGVSADGKWTEWIVFFLKAVAAQSRDAVQRIRQLHDLRTKYHERVREGRSAGALIKLVDTLFEVPVMTNPRARAIIGQSIQTTIDNVRRLVEAGILRPVNKVGRTNYFIAQEIFDVINRAEAVPAPLPEEPAEPNRKSLEVTQTPASLT
jgi:Fic family protein